MVLWCLVGLVELILLFLYTRLMSVVGVGVGGVEKWRKGSDQMGSWWLGGGNFIMLCIYCDTSLG